MTCNESKKEEEAFENIRRVWVARARTSAGSELTESDKVD